MIKMFSKIMHTRFPAMRVTFSNRKMQREKLALKNKAQRIENRSSKLEGRELRGLERHLRWEVINDLSHGGPHFSPRKAHS